MSGIDVFKRHLKLAAAVAGGVAIVSMGLIGVAAGSAPDARAWVVPQPTPMTAGQTQTETVAETSTELTKLPKARPVLKAPRYGG